MKPLIPYLLLTFINMAGFAIIFPVLPEMLNYFQTTFPESGAWLTRASADLMPAGASRDMQLVFLGGVISLAYSLTAYFAAPLWGRLSDKWGRRPVILISTSGLLLTSLIWIFSPGIGPFFLSRLLAGSFSGSLGVVAAALSDSGDEDQKARSLGYFGAALGAGMLLGPVLGGLLSLWDIPLWHKYSHLAIATCCLYVLSLIVNRLWMAETHTHRVKAQANHPFFPAIWKIPGRDFKLLWLIYFLYCVVFSAIDFVMPYFYRAEFSLLPHSIALVFLLIGGVLVFGQAFFAGPAMRAWGYRRVLILSLSALPLPLVLVGFTPPHFMLSLLGIVPIALCGAFFMPVVPGLGTALAPAAERGYYMGLLDAARAFAFSLGPVAGAILYFFLGAKLGLGVMAVIILCAALLARKMRNPLDPLGNSL